jgi:phosphate-selective porin OprO and OprP
VGTRPTEKQLDGRVQTFVLGALMVLCTCAPQFAVAQQVQATEPVEETTEEATEQTDGEARVAALLDDDDTNDLHDDTTLLRNVGPLSEDGLVLFDALRIWMGGAIQYDYYNFDGIFNHSGEGGRREGANMRRLEGTLRSQLFQWGEIKAQYDFDSGQFRDLYLRWVSELPETPVTVTIGNQKEPIGMDNLYSNKFSIAQERSAPGDALGTWRSQGVRLHKAFQLKAGEHRLEAFRDDAAFVTTSVGIFTEDIESSHQTDVAVTGRITTGRSKDGVGRHLGFSASYREGEFYRVSFKPEVREADRIVLARPSANTLGLAGIEASYNKGRLYLQAEAMYSEFAGRLNGYGAGGYLEAGWFLTQDRRVYNSRWGILAPHRPAGRYSVELYGRLSHTRGNDDENGWNDYKAVTIGTSLFYRKLRGSLEINYGETREPINGEADGLALTIRAQYLF